MSIATTPDERLHDMRRDLRSTLGYGPRGLGTYFVNGSYYSANSHTADKSDFVNSTGKKTYDIRIGDLVMFKENSLKTGLEQLCVGSVTAISGDTVTFTKHAEISIEGVSPTVTVRNIMVGENEHGHSITITTGSGQTQFDVMDGTKGDKGDPFEFSDFTSEQLDSLRSDIASVYCRKREASLLVSPNGADRLTIPFNDYGPTDMLFVDVNGLSLVEGNDYVIDGNQIVLTTRITHQTDVNFKLISALTLNQQDFDALADSMADFSGATASADGTHGLVPVPTAGNGSSLLLGNGEWHNVYLANGPSTSLVNVAMQYDDGEINRVLSVTQIPAATQQLAGVMSAADKTKLDNANVIGMMTQNNGFQRVIIGDGYADVPLLNASTGLINEDNIPHPCGVTRPSNPTNGMSFFDANIRQPIWYYDGSWYDSNGVVVPDTVI